MSPIAPEGYRHAGFYPYVSREKDSQSGILSLSILGSSAFIRCGVFFAPPQLKMTGVATLDPLGAGLAPGPEAYFVLMRALAAALVDCLEGG